MSIEAKIDMSIRASEIDANGRVRYVMAIARCEKCSSEIPLKFTKRQTKDLWNEFKKHSMKACGTETTCPSCKTVGMLVFSKKTVKNWLTCFKIPDADAQRFLDYRSHQLMAFNERLEEVSKK